MNKTIYIAGAVSGLPEHLVQRKFHDKEAELLALGHDIINPVSEVKSAGIHDRPWKDVMKYCIGSMMRADEVHLLPCWTSSRGAIIERNLAISLGMRVVYPS